MAGKKAIVESGYGDGLVTGSLAAAERKRVDLHVTAMKAAFQEGNGGDSFSDFAAGQMRRV